MPDALFDDLITDLNDTILRPYRSQQQKITPLDWAMKYRSFGGLPPEIIPAMQYVYEDLHHDVVILKAAQVFISEYLINLTLWCADTGWGYRGNALYVMPTQTHMDDFSQARFTKAIEESEYLTNRMSTATNRIRLRSIGPNTMYFRGSDTTAQIRTIDADVVINDEVDIFAAGAVDKSRERLGSARSPLWRAASQPTYPEVGIDTLYCNSDQRKWFIKCDHCNYSQTLTWDDNVIFNLNPEGQATNDTEVRLVCNKCRRWIDPLTSKGNWEIGDSSKDTHGYHLSKLLSPRANLRAMLEKFLAVDDVERLQSFYTADLGIPYRPHGSKPAISDYSRAEYEWKRPYEDSYMGIDVGNLLHTVVLGRDRRGSVEDSPFYLVDQRYFHTFEELDDFYLHMKPKYTVIDAGGDPRATTEWAEKYPGRVYRWQHVPSKTNPEFSEKEDQKVRYDRTSLLDQSYTFGRARPPKLILHSHITPDFVSQITAPVRELVRDSQNRLVPRYVAERADHYAFSLAFAICALIEFGIGRGNMQPSTTPRYNDDGDSDSSHKSSLVRVRPRWVGNPLLRR